jgi:hypothetical protein
MSQSGRERPRALATVLVASHSSVFVDIVSDMILGCGFAVATAVPAEPPWLSVTRTQPALVICDCGGASDGVNVKPLVVEVIARGLPMLLAVAARDRDATRRSILPARVAWLDLPVDRAALRALMDRLMLPIHTRRLPAAPRAHRIATDVAATTPTLADLAIVRFPGTAHTPANATVRPLRRPDAATPFQDLD